MIITPESCVDNLTYFTYCYCVTKFRSQQISPLFQKSYIRPSEVFYVREVAASLLPTAGWFFYYYYCY